MTLRANSRYPLVAALALALVQAAPLTAAADADAAHQAISAACTELVLDYAYFRDRLDADAVANLFTEDARMFVLGETFNGRQAIRRRIEQAKASADNPTMRHMMSTIRIFPIDAGNAEGVSYITVYGAVTDKLPAPVDGFLAVGEYRDKFVLTAAGWKIADREFVPVFTPTQN